MSLEIPHSDKRVFLLGTGIAESISPKIQNSAFRELGLDVEYTLFDLNESEFFGAMRKIRNSDDIIGFNVTHPFKERVIRHLSSIDAKARVIGAVNTVEISESGLRGFNTDCDGVETTLKKLKIDDSSRRKHGVIIGAGGVSRACIYALAKHGFSSLLVLNRTKKRADLLAHHFMRAFPRLKIGTEELSDRSLALAVRDCDLLINAISSSTKDSFPVRMHFGGAKRGMIAFDLGYEEPSLFLKTALNQGIKAVDGLPMLVEQAARSFEIWTGRPAPRKVMMAAALAARK